MGFVRLIYNLLAIIGAVVIGFIVFASAVSGWKRITGSTPQTSVAARASKPSGLDARPMLTALPVGRADAESRGMLVANTFELFTLQAGQPTPRTSDAWIERHGRGEFLVVSPDALLRPRRDGSRHVAFRLPDGSAVRVHWIGRPGVGRVGFARFYSRPPEGLVIVTLPGDSILPAGR